MIDAWRPARTDRQRGRTLLLGQADGPRPHGHTAQRQQMELADQPERVQMPCPRPWPMVCWRGTGGTGT